MLKIQEQVVDLGVTAEYVSEMLDIIVSDNVNLKGDLVKRSRQVNTLESKLGSIHTVDFKAQQDSKDLRVQVQTLKQDKKDADSNNLQQIDTLKQTVTQMEQHNAKLIEEKLDLENQLNESKE